MSWPRKNHFANQQNDVKNKQMNSQKKQNNQRNNDYQKNLEFENPKEEIDMCTANDDIQLYIFALLLEPIKYTAKQQAIMKKTNKCYKPFSNQKHFPFEFYHEGF